MLDRCWAETGQVPSPFVPSLLLPGGPVRDLGTFPLLSGESKDRSPHRVPTVSQGLPVGLSMRRKRRRRGWEDRLGGEGQSTGRVENQRR